MVLLHPGPAHRVAQASRAGRQHLPAAGVATAPQPPRRANEADAGRLLLDLAAVAAPQRVERALAINALVRVSAEEIALPLDEVRGKLGRADAVVVGERRSESRDRNAGERAEAHDAPPGLHRLADLAGEIGVGQKQRELRVALIGLGDAVEEDGANDAAAPPDARHRPEVHVPAVLLGSLADELESLYKRYGIYVGQQIAIRTNDPTSLIGACIQNPPTILAGINLEFEAVFSGERTPTGLLLRGPSPVGKIRVWARASGTEPKAKLYIEIAEATSRTQAEDLLQRIAREVTTYIRQL